MVVTAQRVRGAGVGAVGLERRPPVSRTCGVLGPRNMEQGPTAPQPAARRTSMSKGLAGRGLRLMASRAPRWLSLGEYRMRASPALRSPLPTRIWLIRGCHCDWWDGVCVWGESESCRRRGPQTKGRSSP